VNNKRYATIQGIFMDFKTYNNIILEKPKMDAAVGANGV
jgi:hypothetical protein